MRTIISPRRSIVYPVHRWTSRWRRVLILFPYRASMTFNAISA